MAAAAAADTMTRWPAARGGVGGGVVVDCWPLKGLDALDTQPTGWKLPTPRR